MPTLFTQFPTIRSHLGLEERHIIFFILTMAVGAVPSMMVGSVLIGRMGSRRIAFLSLPVFLAFFTACFMVAPSYPLFLGVGFFMGMSTGFLMSAPIRKGPYWNG